MRRKLLITGCGRSGTLYLSRVFRKAGMDVRHESVGKYGCCSMYFITDTTDCSIVNEGQKVRIHESECRSQFSFDHVWYVVRHPLRTIDSLAKSFTRKVRRWTGDQLGVPTDGAEKLAPSFEEKVRWAARYWVVGTEMAVAQSTWGFRIEDFPWEEALDRLGEPRRPLPFVSKTTNRGLRFAFKSKEAAAKIREEIYGVEWKTLADIGEGLEGRVREVARRVGYRL